MKQTDLGLNLTTKRTRKGEFLAQMERVVPWAALVERIAPYSFGMKAHIGVDADSGLVHTVRGTSGHVGDVTEGNSLLHGQEVDAFGDAGYQGIGKRPDAKDSVTWHIAMRPGKRRVLLDQVTTSAVLTNVLEKFKAGIRATVEHPFRVVKRQFGYAKVRYKGLKKNTAQLVTLFALSNLWMVRAKLLWMQG